MALIEVTVAYHQYHSILCNIFTVVGESNTIVWILFYYKWVYAKLIEIVLMYVVDKWYLFSYSLYTDLIPNWKNNVHPCYLPFITVFIHEILFWCKIGLKEISFWTNPALILNLGLIDNSTHIFLLFHRE